MSEVRMNCRPQKQQPQTSFFITCNYANIALADKHQAIKEDLEKLQEKLQPLMVESPNDMAEVELATAWEEVGTTTGNPHWHGIVKLTRAKRMRLL